MGRIFIGSIVGAVVVWVWGFLAWGVLNLYQNAFTSVPNADAVVPALKSNIPETGAYFFPPMPADHTNEAAMKVFDEQHRAGPIGLIMYRSHGAPPMDMMVMIRGFCIYFVAAMLLSCVMLAAQLRNFALRLGFVIIAAAFAAMVCHVALWNWMMFPDRFSIAMTIDTIIARSIAGVFLAAIVRPKKPVTA